MGSTLSLFLHSQQAKPDILQRSEQYLVKLLEPEGEYNIFEVGCKMYLWSTNIVSKNQNLIKTAYMGRLFNFFSVNMSRKSDFFE